MKKYLFLFVTVVSLALFSGRAHAQRYLPGMKGDVYKRQVESRIQGDL